MAVCCLQLAEMRSHLNSAPSHTVSLVILWNKIHSRLSLALCSRRLCGFWKNFI